MNNLHVPVLLYESIDALIIKKNGIYIDCTFGRGGHSSYILSKLNKYGTLISLDIDPEAIKYARDSISDVRFHIFHNSFSNILNLCKKLNLVGKIDGIILDLGLCSSQIDTASRGFSFMHNGPLDMRMNNSIGIPAFELLQNLSVYDIHHILKIYGEEKYSWKIANLIKNHLSCGFTLCTTKQLSSLIAKSIKKKNKHPATQTFQALRMYINKELDNLKIFCNTIYNILNIRGRIAVISFNSLEDRIVKNFFYNMTGEDIDFSLKYIPILEKNKIFKMKWIVKKMKPSVTEVSQNIRSRSAILRIVEKN